MESKLERYDIDIVFLSSWEYRTQMRQSISKNFPDLVVFDPYEAAKDKLPQINGPFYTYRGNNKIFVVYKEEESAGIYR